MYQVKCSNGVEIQVIGKSQNGLCRVMDSNNNEKFSGTYAECVKYCEDRRIIVQVPNR